jgi:glutamate N-acetyltransferase/amino-acid N-acetyltransferase
MKLPIGFRTGAVKAGIKPSGKHDLTALVSETPCAWAYVGTTNAAAAACVHRNRDLLASNQPVQAVVVNAGNANCATGQLGFDTNERMAQLAARAFNLEAAQVLTASTGVIGQPLPIEKLEAGFPQIQLGLNLEPFSTAIMTTDLVPKVAEALLPGGARVVGVCKGSGMIAPNMATMLAYVVTDALVDQTELRGRWKGVIDRSFNQVTVDTDTSTNDMGVILANGAAGAVDAGVFWQTVEDVCVSLARQLARDGEGATKLLTVRVIGARSEPEARQAALSVAASPLWKSAVYGNDPNWGRIMMALGKSGATFDPANVCISLQGVALYDTRLLEFDRAAVSASMRADEIIVEADLREGSGAGVAWGCDLTEGYVKINAEYTT